MKGDYSKAVIYGLRCKNTNKLYIGSTCQGIETRKSKHETDYRGYLGLLNKPRNYRSSFEILEEDNYEIYNICDYPCKNKRELESEETRRIIEARNDPDTTLVNKRIPVILPPVSP
tara:strand:- start:247 stop:594 length:348 start_codon:yes stop_codon:yes gene_type:complete